MRSPTGDTEGPVTGESGSGGQRQPGEPEKGWVQRGRWAACCVSPDPSPVLQRAFSSPYVGVEAVGVTPALSRPALHPSPSLQAEVQEDSGTRSPGLPA